MLDKIHDKLYLGIDIGSVSISYAILTEEDEIVKTGYYFHYGNVRKVLEKILSRKSIYQIGFNQKAADFINYGYCVNEQIAIIEGVRLLVPDVGSIFTIGGENFGLILFDQQGRYQKCITNSSCAAGTGAFLDQQASRLGLKDSAQLSKIAQSFQGEPPKIATRCAVFANTDLIHCQQQGYSLSSICAGLCQGLAHNIADTLVKGVKLRQPIVAVGGVSKNNKVMEYLSQIIGQKILVPRQAHIAGALGCAIIAREKSKEKVGPTDHPSGNPGIEDLRDIIIRKPSQKSYFFKPLEKQQSFIPDFSCYKRYVSDKVEVDLYERPIRGLTYSCYLGIDIGSTSTKALLLEESGKVLLGVYTRTMGQPIEAVKALFKTLHDIEKSYHLQFHFLSVGTTGSGRKFIQKVIGADLAIDEITAHARAAYFLNPDTDTIIEIGGQDSKFTVMKDGQVTFSVMNYVCAAGTGSFIEEQAKKLKTPLDKYAQLATGVPAPLTSDRCTVFMERDLNHLLSQGYTKQELLAATLHSVRDNYLSKVAHWNKIGQIICFQGATAKNQALVLAFEQKLRKPIFVSKYCHLTGALGICLIMKEKNLRVSQFRGLEFYKSQPQVYDEICEHCKNHCKLKKIKIGQETIGWGYLCGRDETDTGFKNKNRSGFDLLSSRRKILRPETPEVKPIRRPSDRRGVSLLVPALRSKIFSATEKIILENEKAQNITIGIPYALYTVEYCQLWQRFFQKLGHKVILSPSKEAHLALGKEIAGAEFCAPIVNLHGHVKYLADKVDFIFIPSMFEDNQSKHFCYYSNYATAILANTDDLRLKAKCICPVVDFQNGQTINLQEIYDSFPETLRTLHSLESLEVAFQEAWNWNMAKNRELVQTYEAEMASLTDIAVVLLGRPYTVLDPIMNKNIPQKFNEFGIKTFFQDMVPVAGKRLPLAREYLQWNHWHYGAQILQAAETVAQSDGVYPVYLTAFKCSPDSFLLEYFKEMMDHYQKPYLILQLDEHSSDVGYETRVEAAIRSFKNHYQSKRKASRIKSPKISISKKITQKTVLIPNYDPIACRLVCAVFENMGYQAFPIEETDTTVHSSLRLNDGQCLPISCITQAIIQTIHQQNLDPARVAFFINALTQLSCNLPQYPLLIKRLLEKEGQGLEKVQVWATEFEMLNFPLETVYDVYFAYLFGGLLRKVACKIRPYEVNQGQTDQVLHWAIDRLYTCFSKGRSKDLFFREVIREFSRIPVHPGKRPQVAIIGDLYVRDNTVFNQNLIRQLEDYGAEVITTPFNYILRLTAVKHLYQLRKYRHYLPLLRDKILIETLELFERRFYKVVEPILEEPFPKFDESLLQYLERYHITPKHGGETAQNVLKIFSLLEHHSGLRLVVHVNPIFCCPALVSEAIFKKIEEDIRIPIVSLTYDGTQSNKNIALVPYLHYLK